MAADLTNLEREVLKMLLTGDEPTLRVLRDQLAASHVSAREFTGAGFFTTFSVPSEIRRVQGKSSFSFGDVIGEVEGLELGAGFVLHVKDGNIDYLEGYSYEEPWPSEINQRRLQYIGGERNWDALRAKFS
jgi:hypothetical protein